MDANDAENRATLASIEQGMRAAGGDSLPRYLYLGMKFFEGCLDMIDHALEMRSIALFVNTVRKFIKENSRSTYGGQVSLACDKQTPLFEDALIPLIILLEHLEWQVHADDRATLMLKVLGALRRKVEPHDSWPEWQVLKPNVSHSGHFGGIATPMMWQLRRRRDYSLLLRLHSMTVSGAGNSAKCTTAAEWPCAFCGGHRVRQHAPQLHPRAAFCMPPRRM